MGKKIQYIGKYNMDEVLLGKGNFARVELATHQITEIKVAIKVIDTKKIKEDYIRQNLHREAKIMSKLRHPNIIRLYETMKAQTLYCLVLEYAAGGELLAYIKSQENSRLAESEARLFVRQLVSALHYLHEKNVVHRDLKMENIMLDDKKKSVKLIDFGLSNTFKADEQLRTHCGSPEYAAPELFMVGKTYGSEVDIWSLGIVIYAIVIGKLPFFTPYKDEYQRQRMQQQIQKGLSSYHDHEMQILHSDCRHLLHQILEPNPEARISLYDIEKHPWITKNSKYPFSQYVQPPKDKQLRHQCTQEMAIMTGHKRMVLEESVKEHKADELSAMYNMLMDKKKKQRGMFDVDHTYKRGRHERDSRSRSRDREKILIKTPDSAKGKEIKGKMLKKGINKAKLNSIARPSSLGMASESLQKSTMSPTKRSTPSHHGPKQPGGDPAMLTSNAPPAYHSLPTPRGGTPLKQATPAPNNPNTLTVPSPTALNHPPEYNSNKAPVPPAGTAAGTSTGVPAPSKIPFSQRSNPPARLNMTLDLSVTNTPKRQRPQLIQQSEEDWDRLHKQVGASVGIAASSGVRPKVSTSPKETKDSKIPVRTSSKKGAATKSAVCSPSRSTDSGSRKPLRPSTLWYIRTSLEKVRRRIPSASNHKDDDTLECGDKDCDADDCDNKETLAPKATPEDSLIDFYSPSGASVGTEEEEECRASNAAECGESGNLSLSGVIVEAAVEKVPGPDGCSVLNTSPLHKEEDGEEYLADDHDDAKPTNRMAIGNSPFPTRCDHHLDREVDMGEVTDEEGFSASASAGPSSSPPHATLSSLDVKQKDPSSCMDSTSKHSIKQLSFELDQTYEDTTASSASQLSKSSQNSVGMCPMSHVRHNLTSSLLLGASGASNSYSGSSIPLRFHFKNQKPSDSSLPNSGSEPLSVGVMKNKRLLVDGEGSERTLPSVGTLSLSNPGRLDNTHLNCEACGLSPDSPTYWSKHSRFSHSGAHALDIFTSPDEVPSPTDAFWEDESPRQASERNSASGGECSPRIHSHHRYRLPKVGADTPRIPMQLSVAASMELLDGEILSCSTECQTKKIVVDMLVPGLCPDKICPLQAIHIEKTPEVCTVVDKPPPPSKPTRARSPEKVHTVSLCSTKARPSPVQCLMSHTTEAVYTTVPDTSLRLEPVGGSSESLDERVQGDGCTEKVEVTRRRGQCTSSSPHIRQQHGGQDAHDSQGEEVTCQKGQCPGAPTDLVKTSVRAAKKQMRNLLQWEKRLMKTESTKTHHSAASPPPPTSTTKQGNNSMLGNEVDYGPCSQPGTPEKKKEGSKFLRQYSPRSKLHSWKQGVSHLLSKSRPGTVNNCTSLNNRQQSNKTTNTSHKNRANSIGSNKYGASRGERCNSIEEAEDQFLKLEHKWTAPLSAPTSNNTVMLRVESSAVPNSCPRHSQPVFDIKVARGEAPTDFQPCLQCAKTEQKNATEKNKISKNGTSPKKPVIIPNSLNRIPSAKASSSRV